MFYGDVMGEKNKKFSDGYLKQKGVDAHEVKNDYGCKPVSHYDIYNGKTVTIESKDGREVIDTGLTKEQFFDAYGYSKSEER